MTKLEFTPSETFTELHYRHFTARCKFNSHVTIKYFNKYSNAALILATLNSNLKIYSNIQQLRIFNIAILFSNALKNQHKIQCHSGRLIKFKLSPSTTHMVHKERVPLPLRIYSNKFKCRFAFNIIVT